MENSNYLGNEKVGKLLRQFSIPCICSLIISCLYNIVDQIFVGNMIGYVANGATGIIFPITVVGWGMSLFFGDGVAASLSVSLGRNETKSIHRSVGNGLLWTFVSGIAIIAISYICGDNLLWLIGATNENIQMAHNYGFIIYAMMPLAMVQNALAAIIRADGSPRYSMLAMTVGAVINIVGDPLCISVWGIQGAAVATVFGQFVSFIICISYLRKSKTFKISLDSFRPDFKLTRKMMSLGTSSLLTQLFIVIVTIINNILLVKYGARSVYGADIPLSAFVVIMKLFQIVLNIAIGIAVGAQPIVGYNYGAKQYDRVKQLLKLVLKWTAIVGTVCTALFEAAPKMFILMFGADSELYLDFAINCLRIYLSLILFTCLQKVCAIFLQSIGHAKAAAPLSALRDVLLILISLVAPRLLGVTGVFWAAPIADALAMVVTAIVMLRLWKKINQMEQNNAQQFTLPQMPTQKGTVITISREHGSGGKLIGQLLADKLGIPCYYKEMVAVAAKESGLAKEFISNINADENAVMKDLYLSTEIVQNAITAQDKAIRKIADSGSCVIVGRSANYVLQEYPNAIYVFIYAPKDFRIKRVMETYGDSPEKAESNIRHADSARANYYKNISGNTWGERHNYDLLIDSSVGIEKCASAIGEFIGKRQNQ